ncbi:serine hydrolase [Paracoccus methylarcula]|uniref:serine hydrolase n=1 Tax=Paracoccus methylarcula TaxID=72022 RepID=UPI001FE8EDB7|nr:serine hydrolase [Paracoccus methylarcula]
MKWSYGCAGICLSAMTAFAPLQARAVMEADFRSIAAEIFAPVMADYDIPGLAVGVTLNGQHYVFTAGMANRETGTPVDKDTIFELGSISKTFNVTLAALAEQRGMMSLDDRVSAHLPELAGSAFDRINLMDLATHQTSGLPLQVPDELDNDAELMRWLAEWHPDPVPGHERSYSNISIGLLGRITAKAMGQDYSDALQGELFPMLGLDNTYIQVPAEAENRYAYGYSREDDQPIRVNPGMLDAEPMASNPASRTCCVSWMPIWDRLISPANCVPPSKQPMEGEPRLTISPRP